MALGSEDGSMRALDLANEAVSSQEPDLPADLGREPSLVRSGGFATNGVKDPLEVAIAKPAVANSPRAIALRIARSAGSPILIARAERVP
jgi:hypothetical protein